MAAQITEYPNRGSYLAYGVICYVLFLGSFLYLVGFLGNWIVPRAIDSGAAGPLPLAIAVNTALVALFGIQHSIMARPGFKKWWTRIVPEPIERSTYVLFTVVILVLMYWLWRPMPEMVWSAETPIVRNALFGLGAAGWLLVLYATFLIDHFDLFGLRQVYLYFRRRPYTYPGFASPMLYRLVRNPLMLGWFIAFWATPDMSRGRLSFAVLMTACGLVGILYEERDLLKFLGEPYRRYRARTPMLLPWPRPTPASDSSNTASPAA